MSKPAAITRDEVKAAETAAQRSVCNLPSGKRPDDLTAALKRRIDISYDAAQDSGVLRRLGGADPEVRKLEAPWSRSTRRTVERRTDADADEAELVTFADGPAGDPDVATFADTTPAEDDEPSTPKSRGRSAKKATSSPAGAATTQEGTR